MALQIQEVAPTDSRGGPHRVWCGTLSHVALCSEGMDLEVAPTDSRGGPHRVWCGTLFHVALSSIQDLTGTGSTT